MSACLPDYPTVTFLDSLFDGPDLKNLQLRDYTQAGLTLMRLELTCLQRRSLRRRLQLQAHGVALLSWLFRTGCLHHADYLATQPPHHLELAEDAWAIMCGFKAVAALDDTAHPQLAVDMLPGHIGYVEPHDAIRFDGQARAYSPGLIAPGLRVLRRRTFVHCASLTRTSSLDFRFSWPDGEAQPDRLVSRSA